MESNDIHEKLKLSNGKGRLQNDIQTDIVLLGWGLFRVPPIILIYNCLYDYIMTAAYVVTSRSQVV